MNSESRDFLYELIQTPSPTGSEQVLQRKICRHFEGIAHQIEPDVHGNLTLSLNPQAKHKVMLAGHCDQIGFLVKYISPTGFLYVDSLGGTDSAVILGEHLIIHTQKGPVEAIVGRKPLSFQVGAEVQSIPTKDEIWLDIGARSEEEALEHVALGNYVTFPLRATELMNGLLTAPALDNKAGLFVCLEVLRRCAARKCSPALHVVSTVQEEIGSRGAATATHRLSPHIGIAVDTIPATDDPGYTLPPQKFAPRKLGKGPTISTGPNTNPILGKMLVETAGRRGIPYQADPSGQTAANDSRVIQTADSGVAAAAVSIPLRNMHTQVEMASWSDLENSIELLTELICTLPDDLELRPFYFER